MKAIVKTFALLFGLAVSIISQANTAKPVLVVIGSDAQTGAVLSTNSIYKRVSTALVSEMSFLNYSTIAETDLQNVFISSQSKKNDQEVFALARTIVDQHVDILVLFTIFTNLDETPSKTSKWVNARASARLIDITSGDSIASFSTNSSRAWRVSLDCADYCENEETGKYAERLAQDLGNVLAEQLDHYVNLPSFSLKYQINLRQVKPQERQKLIADLQQLEGYKGIDSTRNGLIYKSTLAPVTVETQLNKILNQWPLQTAIIKTGRIFSISVNYPQSQTQDQAQPNTQEVEDILFGS